jgi:hypothetical protein
MHCLLVLAHQPEAVPQPQSAGRHLSFRVTAPVLVSARCGCELDASDVLAANTKQDCCDSSNPSERGHDRDRERRQDQPGP